MISNLSFKNCLMIVMGIVFVLIIIIFYQTNMIKKIENKQKSEFILETKLEKEQSNARTLSNLKALIDDNNTPKESRVNAASNYIKIVTAANNESQIELILKNKGYDDVVAFISDDRIRIIMQDIRILSTKQINEIKKIVMDVAKISVIEVELKW